MYQSPTTHAEFERTAEPNLGKDNKRPNEQTKDIQKISRQCLRSNDVIRRRLGGKLSGYYQFKMGFYGSADIPTIFQEEIDRPLEYCTPAWFDEIIVVTRGDRKHHEKKLFAVFRKLEITVYRATEIKSDFFQNILEWLGHEIDEDGIKPNKEKVEAILELKHTETPKQLKSFLGAIQCLTKILPRLSERTDKLRKLLKTNRMEMGNGTAK